MTLKNNRGFTLIEIVIVVVIIGIMAAIALPNYFHWLPNMRLKQTARDMYSDVQKAKVIAMKRGSCVSVSFTTVGYPSTGGGYTVFVDDGEGAGGIDCNGIMDGAEDSIITEDFSTKTSAKDVSLDSASIGGSSTVCFTPTTMVCGSQSGNIQLRNKQSRWYKATVLAAGGVRMEMSGDGINWSN